MHRLAVLGLALALAALTGCTADQAPVTGPTPAAQQSGPAISGATLQRATQKVKTVRLPGKPPTHQQAT